MTCRLFTILVLITGLNARAGTNPNFPVGVVTHLYSGELIKKTKDMGAKWLRISAAWQVIEPQRGSFDYSAMDQAVADAEKNDLLIFATLGGTPVWAGETGDMAAVPKKEDWENFVTKTVQRYQYRVQYWGIWNEPNLARFWAGTLQEYIDILLIPGHRIIKSINPHLQVAGPELAHLGSGATITPHAFYSGLRDAGVTKLVDVVTHHVYADDIKEFRNKLTGYYKWGIRYKDGVKQILDKTGFDKKPLWITEFGWDASSVSEKDQAKYLMMALQYMARERFVHKAFIYMLQDWPYEMDMWGLFRTDATARPAYSGVRDVIASGFK